jgi:predicted XRE-type DNA-binding protein
MAPTNRILALRRELAREIIAAVGPGAQFTIAPAFGISQPRMSELERGQVERCSMEWLITRVHRMGGTVRVTVELPDVRRAVWTERFAAYRRRLAERAAAEPHSKIGIPRAPGPRRPDVGGNPPPLIPKVE